MADQQQDGSSAKSKMWDVPVRAFHILIIILVGVQWYSGTNMGIAEPGLVKLHIWSGCTILALVVFRIVWGFVGSTTARFSHFVRGPAAVWRYATGLLKRTSQPWTGHNPLGGLSVVLMLAFLLVMPLIGLFSADDEVPGFGPAGPLSHLVPEQTSYDLGDLHHDLWEIFSILLIIHIAAVLFYLIYKRQNLIRPMLTGHADVEGAETLRFRPLWLALIILAITAGAVALAVTLL